MPEEELEGGAIFKTYSSFGQGSAKAVLTSRGDTMKPATVGPGPGAYAAVRGNGGGRRPGGELDGRAGLHDGRHRPLAGGADHHAEGGPGRRWRTCATRRRRAGPAGRSSASGRPRR